MAVFQSIRRLFLPRDDYVESLVVPAGPTTYTIKPLNDSNIAEVLELNARCFRNGENYTKHTFAYLFAEPNMLSYQIVSAKGEMTGFVFVIVNKDGVAHLTTIGIAPEHRRRGLAIRLLNHLEEVLRIKGVSTIVLEVRVGNHSAKALYKLAGFISVNRLPSYYSDGEDCFMMVKSIVE